MYTEKINFILFADTRWGPTNTCRKFTARSRAMSSAFCSESDAGSTDSYPPSTGPLGLADLTKLGVLATEQNKVTLYTVCVYAVVDVRGLLPGVAHMANLNLMPSNI